MSVIGGTSSQTKFFSSGQIKFSELRTTFNSNAGSNNIKFSTYRRNTDLNETDPIVPDSTENRTTVSASEGISTQDDLKIVSFRNSIKQYVVTQSSSNTEVTIHSGSGAGSRWNANLDKNVKKFFNVNGTIDADSPSDDAAVFDAEAYNLTIDVTGNIYGEGGTGGSANGGSGGNGGDALYVNNTSSRSGSSAKVIVKVNSNGRIWAGGGGGAAGGAGNSGSSLSCYSDSTISKEVYSGGSTNPGRGCNACPNTSGNANLASNGDCYNNTGNRSRCRQRQERGQTCTNSYSRNCVYRTTFTVAGGNGGNGGNGGVGEGANNNQGSGNGGNSGNTNNCSANGNSSTGNSGNSGASGGTWGADGGNAGNISGGTKGRAVFRGNGNTFFLNGQSSNNVKGTVSGKV